MNEPKVTGQITTDFWVYCPQCEFSYELYHDRKWFQDNIGFHFPSDGVDGTYECTCDQCGCEFTVEGFEL